MVLSAAVVVLHEDVVVFRGGTEVGGGVQPTAAMAVRIARIQMRFTLFSFLGTRAGRSLTLQRPDLS